MTEKEFRLQARTFFLTYSNCKKQGWLTCDKETLFGFLKGLIDCKYLIVCEEKHEDGELHYHALVISKNKKDVRNSAYFDYHGVHPNIQIADNIAAVTTYIKKDGNFVETPTVQKTATSSCLDLSVAAHTNEFETYMQLCFSNQVPFQYAKCFWDLANPKLTSTIFEADTKGTITGELLYFAPPISLFETKCIVLIGASGIGKTSWVLRHAPLPILFVTHMDNLRDFDPKIHKSIVFDDMSFLHIPREGQIHLVDQYQNRSIHCRYSPSLIPKGTPKYFTANKEIFNTDEAIERRVYYKRLQ